MAHFNGDVWTETEVGDDIFGIWGSEADDVWAVGINATFYSPDDVGTQSPIANHFDGATWTASDLAGGTGAGRFVRVWSGVPDDVWAVGWWGMIQRFDGSTWSKVDAHELYEDSFLTGVWDNGDGAVFVAGSREPCVSDLESRCGGVIRYDGNTWTEVFGASGEREMSYGIRGAGSALFAPSKHGQIYRFDGSTWSVDSIATDIPLYGVWARTSDDVFVVGDKGTVAHYDGVAWTVTQLDEPVCLIDVWGTESATGQDGGTNDVYAVGGIATGNSEVAPVVLHFDGWAWAVVHGG